MKAMILAAGRGERLGELTVERPKPLLEVGGETLIERHLRRLHAAGVGEIVINISYLGERIRAALGDSTQWGQTLRYSEEDSPALETGGGLKHAAPHFRGDAAFFLHNVDIVTEIPLRRLYAAHAATDALATLAVSARESTRLLRFDDGGLQAHVNTTTGTVVEARPAEGETRDWAFTGVHVVSPSLLELMEESGAFSIFEPYMRLAGAGHAVLPFDIGPALWLEIGSPDRLEHARRVVGGTAVDEQSEEPEEVEA